MKKLLLGTAAIALAATFVASPANAQVSLDVSGHFKGYVSWIDQDEEVDLDVPADGNADEARSFDILRETEIHFSGETTLDNGLTVGIHVEADLDGDSSTAFDDFYAEETYAYFSGAWGRVNFGKEDGAAYLLQVAAPSADSNIDGLRQYVSPVNYALNGDGTLAAGFFATVAAADAELVRFDYDLALSEFSNKLTYMTPVFNGFQAGVSYTPDSTNTIDTVTNDFGVSTDDVLGDYGEVWDVAGRYEGQFDEVGVTFGGGYSHAELEEAVAAPAVGDLDDREAWNVGVDFDWKAFGLGAAYTEDDMGTEGNSDRETWVVGIDYTTGPFKLGASYYDQEVELDGVLSALDSGDAEIDRWTAGVVYTYGPGMTFRGSISMIDHEVPAAIGDPDFEATSVMLGTQINF